jgi:translation initiation factor 2 gamma subunit (eIF-2gamma)
MAEKFEPLVKLSKIGHMDHGRSSLTAALVRVVASGVDVRELAPSIPLHMPDDLVVVRNCDADEAGDYRVMRHGDAVGNPQWEITNTKPADLD